jgi:adenylosuccinate lyase
MLALIDKGSSREEAYGIVQRHAMKALEAGGDFHALLAGDPAVKRMLSTSEVAACFDLQYHLKHVDTIFARVFGR